MNQKQYQSQSILFNVSWMKNKRHLVGYSFLNKYAEMPTCQFSWFEKKLVSPIPGYARAVCISVCTGRCSC